MSDDEEEIVRDVFVDWIVPKSIPTQRATHIIIQKNGPTEFVVSLFEQREHLLTGSLEEQLEQFGKVERVSAVCVARFPCLTPRKLVEFAHTFGESLEEFKLTIPSPIKEKGDQ